MKLNEPARYNLKGQQKSDSLVWYTLTDSNTVMDLKWESNTKRKFTTCDENGLLLMIMMMMMMMSTLLDAPL